MYNIYHLGYYLYNMYLYRYMYKDKLKINLERMKNVHCYMCTAVVQIIPGRLYRTIKYTYMCVHVHVHVVSA